MAKPKINIRKEFYELTDGLIGMEMETGHIEDEELLHRLTEIRKSVDKLQKYLDAKYTWD